jgi:hypothetical protein
MLCGGPCTAVTTCDRCPCDTNFLGQPSDFLHAGADNEIRLLGAFSIDSAPRAEFPNTWDVVRAETAITSESLDAVCLCCHTDQRGASDCMNLADDRIHSMSRGIEECG